MVRRRVTSTKKGRAAETERPQRLLDGLDGVPGADGAHHGGNVDPGPGDAGLPESNTRVHRDLWVDLRGDRLLRAE